MTKVLITGGTGFIGGHLARMAVSQGYDVACLVRASSATKRLDGLSVRRVCGDVTNRDSLAAAVQGQDIVFHLAGCVTALRASRFYEINEQGTRNIAEACAARTTPPVLIVVSSLAAVGPSSPERPRREDDPPRPVSHYGWSKLAGENVGRQLADRVPTTIVRPPVVFGEGDPATCEIYRPIARWGVHVVPTRREHWFSLIHVDDLANLLLLAAESGKRLPGSSQSSSMPGQGCYFAACEQDVTYAQWGRMIGDALGCHRTWVLHVGPAIRWTVASVATAIFRLRGRPWYFNLEKAREAGAGSWTCSAEAAAHDFGITVSASLRDRIDQTVRWYCENGWLPIPLRHRKCSFPIRSSA